ncbi:NAD(+)--rifampin ADP-ribosyltransferase [Exiguobacterium sp. PFWT01]|nr:NAD(+)--rifampin ADP-ribosyltransferase [Exiguobacterium sp. PFWT01]QUP88610.1 NAD(+)--rifampin ADP-ribosyltransferase [Exiguobacterium sp. PFWT01]
MHMKSSVQLDPGPFFHGTKAELVVGDLLEVGHMSNHRHEPLRHLYFTATLDAAKWGAELAKGNGPEQIYIVDPVGNFENDPNLTDQRFPGNPTRSYRTIEPLLVVGVLKSWERHSEEMIEKMRSSIEELRLTGNNHIID